MPEDLPCRAFASALVVLNDHRRLLATGLLVAACIGPTAALAAKVYRCGNVFQDQPCVDTKVADARVSELGKAGPASPASCPAGTSKDANGRGDCAKRDTLDASKAARTHVQP